MSAQPRGMSKGRRWRAGFGYALVLATLVVPSGIVLYSAVRAADARDYASASYVLDASRAERLRSLGLELGLDVRVRLIRSDPVSADAFRAAKQHFDQALLDLRANAGPEGRSLLVGIAQRRTTTSAPRSASSHRPARGCCRSTRSCCPG